MQPHLDVFAPATRRGAARWREPPPAMPRGYVAGIGAFLDREETRSYDAAGPPAAPAELAVLF
jgi:hypothetical protein